jgi:arylsulfatase A-like enzyme
MIAHDLGRHIGPYGHATDKTPHLNQLAEQSIKLDAHFATSPGCSPSRASLITGQYPHTNGQFGLAHLGWDLYHHPTDHPTLPQTLRDAGYQTALFGIWHLHEHSRAGFEHIEPDHSTRDASPDAFAHVAADRVEQWFDNSHDADRPFYLHVGFWETHRPFRGHEIDPENWIDPDPSTVELPPYLPETDAARQEVAELHTAIDMLDSAVGRVLAALERSGRADNTLVLFTADHGLPFQRAKGTLYGPGIAIPLIARWPGRITPGANTPALSSNVDIMPTLLEAVGLPAPESTQGRSILPILLGQSEEAPRDAVYSEKSYHEHYDPIRSVRTERYSYIRNFAPRPMMVLPSDIYNSPTRQSFTEDESLWSHRPAEELYDLTADPGETNNLALEPVDPVHDEVLQTMRAKLDAWMAGTDDPILRGPIPRPNLA